MSLTIVLQSELGERFAELADPANTILTLARETKLPKNNLFRFIDPYGDTVFNRLQCKQLSDELDLVADAARSENEKRIVERFRELIVECQQKPHRYIRIIGD